MRASEAARLGYGLLLLTRPEHVARVLALSALDRRGRVTARVLGVRHIGQALLIARHGSIPVRRAGRAVDLLHAGSMLLLAAWVPGRAPTALADAAVATLFASSSSPMTKLGAVVQPNHELSPAQALPQNLLNLPAPSHPQGTSVPSSAERDAGAAARRTRRRDRQDALNEVLDSARGHSLEETRAALTRALAARGLAPPPGPWLDAAAVDLVNGNIYVVNGAAMQDTGLELPPHGPT